MTLDATDLDALVAAARQTLGAPADVARVSAISATTDAGRAVVLSLVGRRCLLVTMPPLMVSTSSLPSVLRQGEIGLRELSSETVLGRAGLGLGFRMEDIVVLQVRGPGADHRAIEDWWRRRLVPETVIDWTDSDGGSALEVSAVFAERGEVPTSQRRQYVREEALGGRVRIEAFELHVTEHCNLRCAHCCNTSPYLSEKTLSPSFIATTLQTMATAVHADVFKIMGGEPLLHPEITEVLKVVRSSGIGDVVRLFTNGLLLHKMDDAFWRALDHLTVSSYSSAPVRPEHLAIIEEKARAFDVVLNVKPVEAFSQVMHHERRTDDAAVFQTWDNCWLRHRCLVARDGRFFSCTRAAYLPELHARVQLTDPFDDPVARRDADSVPLDHPDLVDAVLSLLNRSQPVNACRFCLGGDGPRERHSQLTRDDVAAGRLRRLPVLRAS
jgi:organic radical activating enzyme